MRLSCVIPALAIAGLVALAPSARAAWHEQEEIPVESPVYRWIDDVATTYPLSRGLLLTRPWTRGDLGSFLDQLTLDIPASKSDPVVRRLYRELTPGGGAYGLEPAISAEEEDASIELSPYLHDSYSEDRSLKSVLRDERAGLQASAALGDHALLFADVYAGNVTPGPHGTPDSKGSFTSNSGEGTAWVDRAYATWSSKGFMVRAGHTWLEWGPGLDGTMALSAGAPAFDLVEARARLVGGAQLEWFVGALSSAGQSYLAGHRLEFRGGPSVNVSLSELARFDGAGNVPLYSLPVIPFAVLGKRVRSAPADRLDPTQRQGTETNVMYAGDFSWTWRPSVRVYGEVAIDDATLNKKRPLAMGWQAGGELRRRIGAGALSLRGQFDRVFPYTYSNTNQKNFASDGFSGFPTGYPLGPDAERFSGRVEWRPSAEWSLAVTGADTRKGGQPLGLAWGPGTPIPPTVLTLPVAQDQRIALDLAWSPSPSLSLEAAGGSAQQTFRAVDHSGTFVTTQATLRW